MEFSRDACALADAGLERHFELMMQLSDTQLVGCPQHRHKEDRADGAKPAGPPPGRRDQNGQRNPSLIPYAIAVGSLHAENIFAGI
jgi:hypothetical protein